MLCSISLFTNSIYAHQITDKTIPSFEKSEKYRLLFPVLICLLNHIYLDSMVDGTEGYEDKNLIQFSKICL